MLNILGLSVSDSFAGKAIASVDDSSGDDVYFADYFDSGVIGWVSESSIVETNVTDSTATKCYSIEQGLVNAESVECSEEHKLHSINALGFTSYSQNLLFKGKTKSFLPIVD